MVRSCVAIIHFWEQDNSQREVDQVAETGKCCVFNWVIHLGFGGFGSG
ncbi:MAG UNVERIFIED_CONTAM: hypothetical protein LVR29_31960 [Microcystis novacekii LVE1205-3]|jgi:hypothetical protein